MAESWTVQELSPQSTSGDMETFSMRRLGMLADRLRNNMISCSSMLEQLQTGDEPNEDEEVALSKLQSAVDNFNSEIKDQTKELHCQEENVKLEKFSLLLFEAQDLVSTLKVHNRRKNQPERDHHPNTTSRLPKLDMMKFDGDQLKWNEFWDSFTASIDKRTDLSDVDKFTYLNSLLEKDAKEAVRGLSITNQNYKIAVEELKDQFGSPELIMDAHYRALKNLPPAGPDVRECRRTRAEIERHLKILSTMGEPVDTNNQLRSTIMDKFPENILYELRKIMKAKGYSVAVLRQSLKDIISAGFEGAVSTSKGIAIGETAQRFTTEVFFSSGQTDSKRASGNVSKSVEKRAHTFRNNDSREPGNQSGIKSAEKRPHTFQNQEPPEKKVLRGCVFCDGPHYHEDCKKYPTTEERKTRLRVQGRCTICLIKGHTASDCRFAKKRRCWHCKQNSHHRSLCPTLSQVRAEPTATLFSHTQSTTILQTAVADIQDASGIKILKARLLFDTGSQKTYVTEKMATALRLETIEDLTLSLYTFGTPQPAFIKTRLVNMNIQNHESSVTVSALVVPTITGPLPTFEAEKDSIKNSNPDKLIAGDADENCPADVLIGNDHYHNFFTGVSEKVGNNLFLLQSKLGWILSGRIENNDDYKETLSFLTYMQRERGKKRHQFTVPDPPLQDDKIKDLWELESIGIRDSPKILEEDEIVKMFNDTTQFYDGRYQVKWPWAQFPSDLHINFGMSLGRLSGLLKRTDTSILAKYDEVLKDQLSKGMIEEIQDTKLPSSHPVHYLPHHCVIQEGKTTKLRIVYDASSKTAGHCSLNEYLYKGPLLLEDLVALLLRFRTHPVGIVADVEKAFLQIGLQNEDRDVTRFLWVRDIHKEAKGDNLIHLRFCRVPFGVISSPFLLAATVKHHLSQDHSPLTLKISQSLYVDNLVTGAKNPHAATELYQTAKTAFDGISMNIREWDSNSEEFLKKIPEEQRASNKTTYTSVLGLKWDTIGDLLMIAFDPTTAAKPVSSKREILRIIAAVYDPCGLIAPLLLPARIFLQQLWVEKYRWDTSLPAEKINEWKKHVSPLKFIKHSSFPRYFLEAPCPGDQVDTQPTIELHCFTDASQVAYSAAVYVRSLETGTVNLAMSRTRLIPIKNRELMTTPKRELLGVLIGTRLLRYLKGTLNLPINDLVLWTDSRIVLGWLKSTNLLQPFVSKRISEINSSSDIRFRFVPSEDNPADLATRPQYSALPPIWLHGPPFLLLPRNKWPSTDFSEPAVDYSVALPIQCDLPDSGDRKDDVILQEDDDALSLLTTDDAPERNPPGEYIEPVTQEDHGLQKSEIDIIKQIQSLHYPKELAKKPSPLTVSLGLFVDQYGILRCSGRLQNAGLPYNQMYPILIPKADPFTIKVIKQIHENNKHVGVSHTLSLLRHKYWVPQGRSQVEAVLKQCKPCVKYGGGPYRLPPMPPLPQERVRLCKPFTYTGLDYLGPLTVNEGGTTQKRWCCLFTCMASRAIRLETVKNLTADEFLLCLRRFVAAQGAPLLIVSDNAAQFKLTAEVVTSPLEEQHKIAWHFIPELSPWQGGFYERLVSLVKHCLRRSLDKALLNDNQLATILKEIETVLNSRPLTHVGTDFDIVLTPADFLNNCGTLPLIKTLGDQPPSITATKADLIRSWSQGQSLLQEFTKLFQDRYLTNLRERAMAPHKQHRILSKLEPRVGAVVQIWDGQSKTPHRAHWKVGKIVALLRSHDGQIRTAQIALNGGGTVNRSISFLYPLELEETSLPNDEQPSASDDGPSMNLGKDPPTQMVSADSTAPTSPTDDLPPILDKELSSTTPSTSTGVKEISPADAATEAGPASNGENTTSNVSARRKAKDAAVKTIRRWTQVLFSLGNPAD